MTLTQSEKILVDLINDYKWDESLPFEKMQNLPIARGNLSGVFNPEYQRIVYQSYGLILFLSDHQHSYFCLPKVVEQIVKEKNELRLERVGEGRAKIDN